MPTLNVDSNMMIGYTGDFSLLGGSNQTLASNNNSWSHLNLEPNNMTEYELAEKYLEDAEEELEKLYLKYIDTGEEQDITKILNSLCEKNAQLIISNRQFDDKFSRK